LKPPNENVTTWKKMKKRRKEETRPAWAGFKTAEVGIAIIMCNIW
jgi:hypothetical protein